MFSPVPCIHLLANSCFIAAASFLVDNNTACGQRIPGRRTNRSLILNHGITDQFGLGGIIKLIPFHLPLSQVALDTARDPQLLWVPLHPHRKSKGSFRAHHHHPHFSQSSKRRAWTSYWCKKVSEIWPQFKFQCKFREISVLMRLKTKWQRTSFPGFTLRFHIINNRTGKNILILQFWPLSCQG